MMAKIKFGEIHDKARICEKVFCFGDCCFCRYDDFSQRDGGRYCRYGGEGGHVQDFAAALGAAGLVETLKSPGPFTVFAPTDEAFAKLPAGTVEELLKPENKKKLVAILTYHVLPGAVMSADIADKRIGAKTVQGQKVHVDGRNNNVTVNKAEVLTADIAADNGVIHVIDTVLLPK